MAEESGDFSKPNPVRSKRHRIKQAKRLPRDLSDEQVSQLWAVISHPRDRAWFALMLRAGLRVGEVVSLTLGAVLRPAKADQPARLRVQGKGQKERLVLLTGDAAAVVQTWLQLRPGVEHDPLFVNERGQPLSANGIEWLLRGYSQTAGLKATPHQLRHTYARQLLEGGIPLVSLSKLLGHSQVTTTQIYTAGADPELAQAYQQAMNQLGSRPIPPLPPDPVAQAGASPDPVPSVPSRPARPFDWEAWAPELPAGLRQPSLAFVQRRWHLWKPQRQRLNAHKSLNYFHRFWRWQLSQRPISQPAELRRADLQAFQQAQLAAGAKPASINRQLDDILALLRGLAEQGQTLDPALFRLKPLAQPERLPRYLPEAQIQQLENYVQQHLTSPEPLVQLENACFFILAHTGIRASECVDLQGQDLDLSGRRLLIRQGKGQRDRVVYLSQTLAQALLIYTRTVPSLPNVPLLRRPDGQPITYSWLALHLATLGQAAGSIRVTPHQLRHTLATRLINLGVKETRIQKLLGHEHLSTTMIYARLLDPTVEADYQQAMARIEAQQLPLSAEPELVPNWPVPELVNSLQQTEPV